MGIIFVLSLLSDKAEIDVTAARKVVILELPNVISLLIVVVEG